MICKVFKRKTEIIQCNVRNFFISSKTKEGDKVTKHAIEIESREERLKCKVVQKGELGDRDELGSNIGNNLAFLLCPQGTILTSKKLSTV